MLKIKDNLFMKSKVKCITSDYSRVYNCNYLIITFIDGSEEPIYYTTIDDVIDLDRKGDK